MRVTHNRALRTIGRRYFEEVDEQVNMPGKPDPMKVKDIMLRHSLVPA